MTLKPVNLVAAIAAEQASFQRRLAANNRILSATAAAKTGEISGTVTGKGKLLSGICVQAYGSQRAASSTTRRHPGMARTRSAHSRPAATTSPSRRSSSCPNRTNWLQQVYKNNNSISVNFNGGGRGPNRYCRSQAHGINGNLRLGGEISGTVTGKSGAKARGICVTAHGEVPARPELRLRESRQLGERHLPVPRHVPRQVHAAFQHRLRLAQRKLRTRRGTAPSRSRLAQHITVNQVLPTGASISGTVTLTTSSGTAAQGHLRRTYPTPAGPAARSPRLTARAATGPSGSPAAPSNSSSPPTAITTGTTHR